MGYRSDEARNCGLTYTAVSRPTTLGDAGSKDIIPYKCFNSALYIRGGTFPQNLEQLTHKIATREEYDKVHMRGLWVKHLMRQKMRTVEHINEKEVLEWTKTTKYTFEKTLQNVRNGSWRVHHRGTLKNIDRMRNPEKTKTTTTGRESECCKIDMTFLLLRNYEMTGQQISDYFRYLCQIKKNCFSTDTQIGESLKSEGQHFLFRKLGSKTSNYVNQAHTMKNKKNNILFIPWHHKEGEGHWTLIIHTKQRQQSILFQTDSTNIFVADPRQQLNKTTIYNHTYDKWLEIRSPQQQEK